MGAFAIGLIPGDRGRSGTHYRRNPTGKRPRRKTEAPHRGASAKVRMLLVVIVLGTLRLVAFLGSLGRLRQNVLAVRVLCGHWTNAQTLSAACSWGAAVPICFIMSSHLARSSAVAAMTDGAQTARAKVPNPMIWVLLSATFMFLSI